MQRTLKFVDMLGNVWAFWGEAVTEILDRNWFQWVAGSQEFAWTFYVEIQENVHTMADYHLFQLLVTEGVEKSAPWVIDTVLNGSQIRELRAFEEEVYGPPEPVAVSCVELTWALPTLVSEAIELK